MGGQVLGWHECWRFSFCGGESTLGIRAGATVSKFSQGGAVNMSNLASGCQDDSPFTRRVIWFKPMVNVYMQQDWAGKMTEIPTFNGSFVLPQAGRSWT